jgi:hypothetical protein
MRKITSSEVLASKIGLNNIPTTRICFMEGGGWSTGSKLIIRVHCPHYARLIEQKKTQKLK